jgi:hypothetical protein
MGVERPSYPVATLYSICMPGATQKQKVAGFDIYCS